MEFTAPLRQAATEIAVKKSRFIGHVFPAFSEEEALGHINAVRKKHLAATHNVFAYSVGIGNFAERASDDGEPKGTAGYPVLDVIKKRGISNVVCVITRYFGGIKLGAGGLVRAYSNAASMTLDKAGLAAYMYHERITAVVDYSQCGKVQREIEISGSITGNINYAEKVTIEAFALPKTARILRNRIRDITSGLGSADISPGKYLPVRETNP